MKLLLPQSASSRIRTLLNIRTPRAIPKRTPRPHAGARTFLEDARMTVQAGMTADLWNWLQDAGWREVTYRPDRRHYRDVPTECVADLIESTPENRSEVLNRCIGQSKGGVSSQIPPLIGFRVKLPPRRAAVSRLRTLLNIRTPRAIPKRTPRPNVGARIFFENVRMTVQAGMTTELWRWLQEAGWREITHRPDRRRYCEVPAECVAELIECAPEQRREILDWCIARGRGS
jgi:hypothetical protein